MKYWIWLTATARISPARGLELLRTFGGPREIYERSPEEITKYVPLRAAEQERLMRKELSKAEEYLERCERMRITPLPILDPRYPDALRRSLTPPLVLYVRGKLPAFDRQPGIAVVGTRHCTPYGLLCAKELSRQLSEAGVIVVSGLADGIDSAAHRGALLGATPTVAVLGTAIDRCYPAHNSGLMREILETGACVSEYPPGVTPPRGSFPQRNRIMAGMCAGVMVVEAGEKSGALITTERAMDYGRDVFALPGPIDSPSSVGSNGLLRSGAKLVCCAEDVLSELRNRYFSLSKSGDYMLMPLRGSRPASVPTDGELPPEERPPVQEAPVPKSDPLLPISVLYGAGKAAQPAPEPPKEPPAVPPPAPAPARPEAFGDLSMLRDEAPPPGLKWVERPLLRPELAHDSDEIIALLAGLDQPMDAEAIVRRTGLSAREVLSRLTMLELEGRIRRIKEDLFTIS